MLCGFEDVSSLSKVIIKKKLHQRKQKKNWKIIRRLFYFGYRRKKILFSFFKPTFQKKNDVAAAIVRNHLWHATVYFVKSKERKKSFIILKKIHVNLCF